MDNPFDSPRMLVDDAEERIASLEETIEAFIGQNERTFGSYLDRKTGEHVLYVQYPGSIPAKISMEIRAIARDLRDALDHAIYASSVSIFGGEPEKTKFLVADTVEGIQDDIRRNRCKDVHEEIITLMVRENACKAGNEAIWSLNQFRNSNTHRVVALANAASGGIIGGTVEGSMTLSTINEWHSTSRQLYFARVKPHGQELKVQIGPTVQVRVHSRFGLGEQSATAALSSLLSEVKRIVMAVETETARIKCGG